MDRGHQPADQSDAIMQHLRHRRQAIGGARSIRNHRMRSLQYAVIHAIDHRGIDILGSRRRDDHLLRACGDVRAGLFLAAEQPGALHHQIHTELFPRQFGGISLCADADAVAVDHQMIAVHDHLARKLAVCGVVACEVCVGIGIAEIVHCHELDAVFLAALVMGPQDVSADSSVTVDRYADRHDVNSFKKNPILLQAPAPV